MRALEHDPALVTRPVSIAYLTGLRIEPHERLAALVRRGGRTVLLVPELERDHAAAEAGDVEVVVWRDGDDPVDALAELIGPADVLAVERGHITLRLAEELRSRLDISEFADLDDELRRLRMVKSPDEIALLQKAAAITDSVCAATLEALRPGQTELEVEGAVLARIADAGAEPSFGPLIQSGPNGALPHLGPTSRRLEPGDLVVVDVGAAWRGYKGDITRMAVLGPPDAEQRRLHDLVLRAHDLGLATVRPGVQAGEVDLAARGVIEQAGEGERFIHRTGHGLGLDGHEEPNFAPGDETVLGPGMVATIEPGVYIQGWGGVRIEDDVVVTDSGSRSLTQLGTALFVVNATT